MDFRPKNGDSLQFWMKVQLRSNFEDRNAATETLGTKLRKPINFRLST